MSDHRLPDGRTAILLSADRAEGLRAEARAILDYLERHPQVTPERVAHMLFRTRIARRHRVLAMVSSRAELLDALRAVAGGTAHPALVSAAAAGRRIGFVFPGQGGQRPGPGKLYYAVSEVYRARVDECAAAFRTAFGHDRPLHYLLDDTGEYHDVVSEMQPAILFHMLGLAALWEAAGVRPAATVAHSLGELAAMVVAGAMPLRAAIVVAGHRSRLAEQLPGADGYTMAVLGIDREQCEELLARQPGWAELAVINAPNLVVVCGERDTVDALIAQVQGRKRFARGFTLRFPAHTSLITGLRTEFEAALNADLPGATFAPTDVACYGSTLGAAIEPDVAQAQYWYWNLRNRVRFDKAVAAAVRDGVDTLIEMSDHPVLQLAVQDNLSALGAPDTLVLGTSLRSAADLGEFSRNLASLAVHDANFAWDGLRVGPSEPMPLPLRDFPHTQWDRRRIWAPYAADTDTSPDPTAVRRVVEHWRPIPVPAQTSPHRVLFVDHTGDCADLASTLAAAAARRGDVATVFTAGQLADGTAPPRGQDRVVLLMPSPPNGETDSATTQLTEFFVQRRWLPALDALRGDGQCWLFTVAGEEVVVTDSVAGRGGDAIDPTAPHAALAAGFRCVAMERPGLLLRHLDLAGIEIHSETADLVVAALYTTGESELAVRRGTLFVKRLALETAVATAPGELDLSHVLIVGGTGRLGLRCCEHLVRSGARRVTLLSRSGETADTATALTQIRRLGAAEIVVARCDVTDPGAVATFAAGLGDQPVTLLLHTAVGYVDAPLAELTAAAVETAVAAKVVGAERIVAAVPRSPDCRVVLFSSVVATFGGAGQILYAATNRLLDVAARRWRERGVDCVSVQWGLWNAAGLLDENGWARIKATGLLPMFPADAIAAGLTPRGGDAMVLAADWPRLFQVFGAFGQASVLADLLPAHFPGAGAGAAGGPNRSGIANSTVTDAFSSSPTAIGASPGAWDTRTAGSDTAGTNPAPAGSRSGDRVRTGGGWSNLPGGLPGAPGPRSGDLMGTDGGWGSVPDGLLGVPGARSGDLAGTYGGPSSLPGASPGSRSGGPVGMSGGSVTGPDGLVGGRAPHPSPGHGGEMASAAGGAGSDVMGVGERVRVELEAVMGADGELTDGTVPLVALGLDSVQALEFRRRIQSVLDRDIQVADILGGASLDDVVLMVAGAGV
ncbi:nocobactin polyketide synthase NbtC [Nocardia aurantia]|uniref:Carrier domain-containing protein n=1 Tax=Nocardia aurantia TaxID=2585199 RepID=A0A7K0DGI8_9NOCA|nr:nocobactin polyketide synthase NbtC [Nocardia aurantia]MQY24925.1 hypothetical protein [Nocardia aurantia]